MPKLEIGYLFESILFPTVRSTVGSTRYPTEILIGSIPLADKQETKLAKTADDEHAIFGLYSLGIVTNRDEWVYDFDEQSLSEKVGFFCTTYDKEMQRLDTEGLDLGSIRDWVDRSIKWTSELESHLVRRDTIDFDHENIVPNLFRPYVAKRSYYAPIITHRRYQMPQVFPDAASSQNRLICFCVNHKNFYVLASAKLVDLHFTGDTQCLPLYRYTEDGERVCNITDWAIQHINDHYTQAVGQATSTTSTPMESRPRRYSRTPTPCSTIRCTDTTTRSISCESSRACRCITDFDIFARRWASELLDLHINFESAEPYPLKRVDSSGQATRPILRCRQGARYHHAGRPRPHCPGVFLPTAWRYMFGTRSALEWVLDQYKEKKPRKTRPSAIASTPTASPITRSM